MKTWIAVTLAASRVAVVSNRAEEETLAQTAPPAGDCVALGTPKPSVTYVYEHAEVNGKVTQVTNIWESVTETASRVRTNAPRHAGAADTTRVHPAG
jgi:hypothetical protein